jgi:5-methylcytosine-specific restriction endonuclease McrA
MSTELVSVAASLSDHELLSQVTRLARHERDATASLVAHLAELDERRLYLGQGCSSLFTYCVEVLRFSENAAYARIQAARAARKFPVVLDRLASGALNLTTLGLLAPHLTIVNHVELIGAAENKSKRQVEEIAAALRPLPDVPASIRKQSATRAAGPATEPVVKLETSTEPVPQATVSECSPLLEAVLATSARKAVIAPLAPERYKIQFTASAETHAKLRQAQDLLRHRIPDGDPAAVIDRALTVLVQHLEKTKLATVDRPRTPRPVHPGSRTIPAAVRRAVWARDRGRCAFLGADGRRCSERGGIEFHHVKPHGDGGEPSVENIQLRCGAHNRHEADLYFGPGTSSVRRATHASVAREARAAYDVSVADPAK